jgi:hypothetical protein
VRVADDDVVDDAQQLILNHSWREHMPVLTFEQLAELLVVVAPVFQRSRPKVRAARKTLSGARPPKVDKGSQHTARRLVRERSGWLCEICSLAVAREFHHRKNRSQGGGWSASNGMDLCANDHQFITEHPEQAVRNGWTVRSHEEPEQVPLLRRGVMVRFDNEGGMSAVDEGAA